MKPMKIYLTVSTILFAIGVVPAQSESGKPIANTDVIPAVASAPAKKAPSTIISDDANIRLKSPISLTAKDANLSEVLRILSDRSGMNFVAGEGVNAAKISIILNSTPLDEAINLLVRAAGLSYEIIGHSVLIARPENLKEETGLASYVVELKYAKADEVVAMLVDLTKTIKVDEGGNRLICYTSPRVILEIERIVKSVDKPHTLVLLETRLTEVSLDKLGQYGINWNTLSPISGGVEYSKSPLSDALKASNWVQMPMNFNLTMDLMVSNGDAEILMDSKLTTTNNRMASLHIGEVVPYVIQSYNTSSTGTGASQEIKKEEVGVIVKMLPHVNSDGQITLDLEPEVSNIVAWKGANSDIPVVRVRKTTTTVRVQDGQKVFIAGLISSDRGIERRKFPILGEIPFIRYFFTNTRRSNKQTNLIIEVTPHIITDPSQIETMLNNQGGWDVKKLNEEFEKRSKHQRVRSKN